MIFAVISLVALVVAQPHPANRCDFMEVQCGDYCCKFMETCIPGGGCCPFMAKCSGSQKEKAEDKWQSWREREREQREKEKERAEAAAEKRREAEKARREQRREAEQHGQEKKKKKKEAPTMKPMAPMPPMQPMQPMPPMQPMKKAESCGFMETQCGSNCCKFMEKCAANGECCKVGLEVCAGKCCPENTICGFDQCVPKTCQNLHKYQCSCDIEPLECHSKGDGESCKTSKFSCRVAPNQDQVTCKCGDKAQAQAQDPTMLYQKASAADLNVTPPSSAYMFTVSLLVVLALALTFWGYHRGVFSSVAHCAQYEKVEGSDMLLSTLDSCAGGGYQA